MDENVIRRFFAKNCTPHEAEQVISYLSRHPELLDRYLERAEWDNTEPVQMDDQFWEEAWEEICRKKPARRIHIASRLAAAAAVALLIIGGATYFRNQPSVTEPIAVASQPTESVQRVRVNHTDSGVIIHLPDSSDVLLSPGSVITYLEPFTSDRRDIQLEGKGRFKVVRDVQRPFTVFAGGLATTALGTEFTINTNSSSAHATSVQLHTGKVVVKQTGKISSSWKKDVYLQPGQQLVYNPARLEPIVSAIRNEPPPAAAAKTKMKNRKVDRTTGDLAFQNSSLSEVLYKLEKHFDADINYDSVELSRKNFTGTISRNDSLAVVLKVIAQMNDLELVSEEGKFTIRNITDPQER